MRIGAKKRPFYRVVVVDERNKRTGGYIELLGTYNPLTEPKDIKLKQDRIDYWIKQGAQPSDGYLRMIGKAPQRPPRKPKKERRAEEAAPAPAAEQPAEKPAEQPQKEEKPENSENSENQTTQNVSESEGQKSESSETPIQSDTSGTPSPSVPTESGYSSSEPSKEEPTK